MKPFKQVFHEISVRSEVDDNPLFGKDNFIAYVDNRYAGYMKVATTFDTEHYWITGLYVKPEFRGYGVVRKLVNAVRQKYNDKPILVRPYAYADFAKTNEELYSMYKHLGFEELSDQPMYLRYAG